MRPRATLLAALLLAGSACGNNKQEDYIDEVEAQCFALTAEGTTLDDAYVAMRGAQAWTSPAPAAACDPRLVALSSNDRCAPAEWDARCSARWYFYAPSLCSPTGGCCQICEARFLESDVTQNALDAKVCGSRFYRRQPCP